MLAGLGSGKVYLRTNKGRDHPYFWDNSLLLESFRHDTAWVHSQEFGVILAGDFNAHTGNEHVLGSGPTPMSVTTMGSCCYVFVRVCACLA